MSKRRSRSSSLVLAAALLLAGCGFSDDTLMPALSGERIGGQSAAQSSAATAAAAPTAAPTAAGAQIARLRGDLQRLQADVTQHMNELKNVEGQLDQIASTVDGLAGGIETRLKSTKVANDPQLSQDFNRAQSELDSAGKALERLNSIASWGQSDGALASYVLQAARAAESDPTTSGTERRQLAEIERDANRQAAAVDQLVTETSGAIANRNLYVAAAHRRLAALGPDITGDAHEATPATSSPARVAPASRPAATAKAAAPAGRRALVTIRFDRPDVQYETQLYDAVKAAVARRPDVAFDVVAVTPPGGASPARMAEQDRNMESVVRSLTSMGVPDDRLRLSAATRPDAAGNEVRIYVR